MFRLMQSALVSLFIIWFTTKPSLRVSRQVIQQATVPS
ncbi:hypothetical protein BTN49_1659 [Candidatus Enterovibrio escicola]|uniref:Uncharacterized protein n=1 Tax=Candidatus Enterovibrio escicola TaxID=1927127 RepID=A0A2A5T3H9_9GAMM|nr:hypothetical protein BTN49_1659 [Candidatus Enterovibrio escacola]